MATPVTLPTPSRRWLGRAGATADREVVAALQRDLRLPEPLCRLLVLRGYGEPGAAKRYLRPRLDQLHDPLGMAGMAQAVERLAVALRRGETILVHGDYDADGACGAALYTRVLRELGGRVTPFIPHRLQDGYDLGVAGLKAATGVRASLILTADCGIVAHEAVEAAKPQGLDIVVTDHHTPAATLPAAVAVVNPQRQDCSYPDKGLAGTGVAFKVCQALVAEVGGDAAALWRHLDLVALATIADVVPLTGENRVLTRYGLRVLGESDKPGVRALMRVAGIRAGSPLDARQVSHVLAPRINAAGRMGDAALSLRLLLTEDGGEADAVARRLDEQNAERRVVESETLAEALGMLEASYDAEADYGIVLRGRGWHAGVIGIVAARIVERLHRPTVLIADSGEASLRGSARSIRGFDIHGALKACAEHLERFGGHRYAAGLRIRGERVEAFRRAFVEHARERLESEDLAAPVEIDLELGLDALDGQVFRYLRYFGPFGRGNPTPVFAVRGIGVSRRPRVVGGGHVKLRLEQNGARLNAIGFRMADRLETLDLRHGLDAVFQLEENRWGERVELRARLVDVRGAG